MFFCRRDWYAMIGGNKCGWYATLGVYPPRTEAGLCGGMHRAWLLPRLTPWAGKSERRKAAQNLACFARWNTGFIGVHALDALY